ncbi:MAG: rhodanese-like domain-containing protein [Prolixibacteraceae bacterium]|nr:rhodanese-like domain-containing protein [Prolixibacteraceae bacterium]
MHIHELNPWKTLVALIVFVAVLVVGFLTMRKPLISYKYNMNESLEQLSSDDIYFYPWQLDELIKNKPENIVLFDIRNNFVFGQGHIPGAENLSANDLTKKENFERLENLNEMGVTVVLYGEDELQANGPWMIFRQVGFDNVKILAGGYQYYIQHSNNLAATQNDSSWKKEVPCYDSEKVALKNGAVEENDQLSNKPVVIQQRKKASVAGGGC